MTDDIVKQHEEFGRIVTEIVIAYAKTLDSRKVTSEGTPQSLEKLFDEPLPETGIAAKEIFERYQQQVLTHAMQVPSPRYFGQFNPTPLPIGVWADALTSSLNQNAGAWRNGPTSAMIEARVIRWLCELVGYDERSFGTLASGGTEANLIALKCARDRAYERAVREGLQSGPRLAVYASEQVHFSVERSLDILGVGRNSLRKIETDDTFHVRPEALLKALKSDRAAGLEPCCVIGIAGTTSTGVVDPLDVLAEIAREHGCWFHVDAAYGGPLRFSDKHRSKLNGIAAADSITFDPHKWMFVPFACGAVLTRDGGHILRDAFDITPEYLNEDRGGTDVEFDFFRYGQMGTRRFNSLKLWMALKFIGRRGYAEIIERQIDLTHYLAARIDALNSFQRVGQVETAVCCFKFLPPEIKEADGLTQDGLQQRLQQLIERSGEAWITTTVLNARRVLRVNINSFLTRQSHIDDLIELLERKGAELIARS